MAQAVGVQSRHEQGAEGSRAGRTAAWRAPLDLRLDLGTGDHAQAGGLPLPRLAGTSWGALGHPHASLCPEPGCSIMRSLSTQDSTTQSPDRGQVAGAPARTAGWGQGPGGSS